MLHSLTITQILYLYHKKNLLYITGQEMILNSGINPLFTILCKQFKKPYKTILPNCSMTMIFGMSPGIFAAWIVGIITVVLALLYPLMTTSEEGS